MDRVVRESRCMHGISLYWFVGLLVFVWHLLASRIMSVTCNGETYEGMSKVCAVRYSSVIIGVILVS